ncbi:MAG: TIM-barrel domain-containing protein [Candidatus Saccharimonadaceae bacterium]
MNKTRIQKAALIAAIAFALPLSTIGTLRAQSNSTTISVTDQDSVQIVDAKKINPTTVEILFSNEQKMLLDFYGNNIFRMFQDNSGKGLRAPEAKPEAKILLDNPRKSVDKLEVANSGNTLSVTTNAVQLVFDKNSTNFSVKNLLTNQTVVQSIAPVAFDKNRVSLTLSEQPDEYFYGGGVQNGRFSHKGKMIAIENQNSWTDGGVASPTPFYWSTKGYGFMGYTFKKGNYDFGLKEKNTVKLSHDDEYLDVFFMINDGIVAILNDFYQLTGEPVFIPKFGFYEGHLNAYNRDFWVEDPKGILFEDGKYYKESQKDNGGVKESLNGEKNNFQFSARGVIDRYKQHDMPLGWVLPNDGYGAGYGQTSTLDGNMQNLKEFGDYARKNGVEIGLWTQSDLHPIDSIEPLLQRDIVKEVDVAGVRVLKTDVAWVGAGYSFGLNGVQDAAQIMQEHGNNARPFIISLDGWAGTQHYATIWSGDQTGGQWEYIRFHIPTYIGSGLSGQPNISSDMDGIFGGKNLNVNIRDFQWKAFTPMQLNMDGWGSNIKYPHALGDSASSINRNYLKLKAQLLPYAYTIAHEAVNGLPMIRAMFLEESNPYTLGKQTQYQFMYGPSFLVAPIYQETKVDKDGNDVRNHIYLPKGSWVDYFSGQVYEGGRVINNFETPIWKLPVFVKSGAIIPMVNPNNNVSEIDKGLRIYEVYPFGNSSFTEYNDDGLTMDYLQDKATETLVESAVKADVVTITAKATTGNFDGFVKEKVTEFKVNVTKKPKKVTVSVGGKKARLKETATLQEFNGGENVYFYDQAPELNQFPTKGSGFEKLKITKNPQLLVRVAKTDVTKNEVSLQLNGFEFNPTNKLFQKTGALSSLTNVNVSTDNATAYTLKPSWDKLANADYYEIELDGVTYSTITDNELIFENLTPETDYAFKARSVNKSGVSAWTDLVAKTTSDPLQFAIRNISAETSAAIQGGQGPNRLFDFDEGNVMHSDYDANAIPFELIIDLKSVNHVDKLVYLPRTSGTNGMIQEGKIYYSDDKENWKEAGAIEWKTDAEDKTFTFKDQPIARYIKMTVEKGVGNFVSGRELYIFKVPGTESFLPGDINNDGMIDSNDLTSYMNYTGLRLGDGDFEGYVSRGDVNKNNLIDAFDISNAATQLEGGVSKRQIAKVEGKLTMTASKANYSAGETVDIAVKGVVLKSVNALSFAIPYNNKDFEYVGIKTVNMKEMHNLTNDRLHTNGEKVLYPTFVNLGNEAPLEGEETIFVIQFKAKRAVKFNLLLQHGLLVDKNLNWVKF